MAKNEAPRSAGVKNAVASVAAAKTATRPRTVDAKRQSVDAIMMDGPMMLRMSTFKSVRGDDQPRIHA